MSAADWILIGIFTLVLIDFASGRVINFLNEQSKNQPLSRQAAEIYTAADYQKSMAYGTANYKLESLSSVISTCVILAAIILGFFAKLDNFIRERISNNLLVTVIFIAVLIVVSAIGSLPASIYSTFVIETKYEFNKTTPRLFIADQFKNLLLSLGIGLPLLYAIAWIYQELQSVFWLVAWLLVASFTLFMFVFGTRIFCRFSIS